MRAVDRDLLSLARGQASDTTVRRLCAYAKEERELAVRVARGLVTALDLGVPVDTIRLLCVEISGVAVLAAQAGNTKAGIDLLLNLHDEQFRSKAVERAVLVAGVTICRLGKNEDTLRFGFRFVADGSSCVPHHAKR